MLTDEAGSCSTTGTAAPLPGTASSAGRCGAGARLTCKAAPQRVKVGKTSFGAKLHQRGTVQGCLTEFRERTSQSDHPSHPSCLSIRV